MIKAREGNWNLQNVVITWLFSTHFSMDYDYAAFFPLGSGTLEGQQAAANWGFRRGHWPHASSFVWPLFYKQGAHAEKPTFKFFTLSTRDRHKSLVANFFWHATTQLQQQIGSKGPVRKTRRPLYALSLGCRTSIWAPHCMVCSLMHFLHP